MPLKKINYWSLGVGLVLMPLAACHRETGLWVKLRDKTREKLLQLVVYLQQIKCFVAEHNRNEENQTK